MAQWINLHRNNSGFVNGTRLPLLCEKSGAILQVLVGLTAGSPAGRQSDEIREDLKINPVYTDRIVRIFIAFYKGTVLL